MSETTNETGFELEFDSANGPRVTYDADVDAGFVIDTLLSYPGWSVDWDSQVRITPDGCSPVRYSAPLVFDIEIVKSLARDAGVRAERAGCEDPGAYFNETESVPGKTWTQIVGVLVESGSDEKEIWAGLRESFCQGWDMEREVCLKSELVRVLTDFYDDDDVNDVDGWYDVCPDSENPAGWCQRWLDAGLDFPKVAKAAHLWSLTPEAVRAEIDKLDDASEESDQRKAVAAARLARDGKSAKELFGLKEIGSWGGAVRVEDRGGERYWVTPEALEERLVPRSTPNPRSPWVKWLAEAETETPLPCCESCGHVLTLGSTIHTGGESGNYVWGTCPECDHEEEIYEGSEGWPSAELYE